MSNLASICRYVCILSFTLFFPIAGYAASEDANKLARLIEGLYVDSRDGREYSTIVIGNKEWFAENFAYLPVVNEDGYYIYAYHGTNAEDAKHTASYEKYGALYSWEKAVSLAPPGWRLPTDEDWQSLEIAAGFSPELAAKDGWRDLGNKIDSLMQGGTLGFNVIFGGWRTDYGDFRFQKQHANFWVADKHADGERAHERLFGIDNSRIGREFGNVGCGFSVRYVRDVPQ